MQLTEHFSLDELCASQTAARYGINNMPPAALYESLRDTALGLERIRALLDAPIHISSGYRSPELNKRIGGARNSQHVMGQAVDFTAPSFGTVRDVATMIAGNFGEIGFDQLILEYPDTAGGWVHVSFAAEPRGEMLTASGRPTRYTRGI